MKEAEINILKARDTTGPGLLGRGAPWLAIPGVYKTVYYSFRIFPQF